MGSGRSLSMSTASTMHVNPDIEESHALQGWYDKQGQEQTFQNQSTFNPSGPQGFRRDDLRTLEAAKQAGFGSGDKPEYFSTRATIMHIKDENLAYPACPTQGCSKKVTEESGGWKCEKCDKHHEAPEYR